MKESKILIKPENRHFVVSATTNQFPIKRNIIAIAIKEVIELLEK